MKGFSWAQLTEARLTDVIKSLKRQHLEIDIKNVLRIRLRLVPDDIFQGGRLP